MIDPYAIDTALTTGLAYMTAAQEADGSYLGQASADPNDFSRHRVHPTAFFTSLIATNLAQVPGAQSVSQKAANFILAQKTKHWSWNYWLPGSDDAQTRPYPDDLDDTVMAFSALNSINPDLTGGKPAGYLARLLVSQETAPGGPYKTWLVDSDAAATWQDVDLAVNANIGYCLHRLGVTLPSLTNYVTEAIAAGQVTSRYYAGRVPCLYFLARWYQGPSLPILQSLIRKELANVDSNHALHISMLLTACSNTGITVNHEPVTALLRLQVGGSWPAATLYNEPPLNSQLYYAGSAALTTSYCLEALALYRRQIAKTKPKARAGRKAQPYLTQQHYLGGLQTQLAAQYKQSITNFLDKDKTARIADIAATTALACQRQLDRQIVYHLNQGSLNGWVAYTIFDNVFDDANAQQLAVAMVALRRTTQAFYRALPDSEEFQRHVNDVLDIVDSANAWEQLQARAAITDGLFTIASLPNYGRLRQLADRSLGHALASTGVLVAVGEAVDTPNQQSLQRFYHHYLIARQLNDDAHDWQEDLASGQVTAVITWLLGDYFSLAAGERCSFTITAELPALRQHFWEHTMKKVAAQITKELALARRALTECSVITQPEVLLAWLDELATSTDRAMTKREEATNFMIGFSASL